MERERWGAAGSRKGTKCGTAEPGRSWLEPSDGRKVVKGTVADKLRSLGHTPQSGGSAEVRPCSGVICRQDTGGACG